MLTRCLQHCSRWMKAPTVVYACLSGHFEPKGSEACLMMTQLRGSAIPESTADLQLTDVAESMRTGWMFGLDGSELATASAFRL